MLENFVNEPVDNHGIAYVQFDYKIGKEYIHCPYCGKKQIPVTDTKKNHYRCKSKKCGKDFKTSVDASYGGYNEV